MTSLKLVFRHCIPHGEEGPHIDRLIAAALERFKGFHKKVVINRGQQFYRFAYQIPLGEQGRENGKSLLQSLGISLPALPAFITVPEVVDVSGIMHFRPDQKVSIDVEHTEVGGLVGRALRPLIKKVVGHLIVKIAKDNALLITAE